MKSKLLAGIAVVMAAMLVIMAVQHIRLRRVSGERDRYRENADVLFGDVERYRVRDSLSAARVQSLELTVKEFERFRAEDAALIKELKAKNRDLSSVNKTQAQTIIALSAIPRDTVIIRDSVPVQAVALHCGDAWYDFDGVLSKNEFTGTLQNRDSLLFAETVKYKRFLGFLWKTRKVKERHIDVVSKNPHTTIKDIQFITIQK